MKNEYSQKVVCLKDRTRTEELPIQIIDGKAAYCPGCDNSNGDPTCLRCRDLAVADFAAQVFGKV